jgi:hypothetical protein
MDLKAHGIELSKESGDAVEHKKRRGRNTRSANISIYFYISLRFFVLVLGFLRSPGNVIRAIIRERIERKNI